MPPIVKKTAGGTNYAIPFVGRVDHTIQVQIQTALLTQSQVDSMGVLKPGVVLPMHGGALGNILGTPQVETATVAGVIGAAGAGNVSVVVTSSLLPNGSKTLAVAVANNDTAAQVATKVRAALSADADISNFYTVSGAGADVVLTNKSALVNDTTLNVALATGTATGLTAAPNSVNTTAGVAPDEAVMVYAAQKIRNDNLNLGADTSKPFVTCAVIAVANRYLVEDNLGRPLTATEIAALRASKITLRQ